jgi:hypothetical protein
MSAVVLAGVWRSFYRAGGAGGRPVAINGARFS